LRLPQVEKKTKITNANHQIWNFSGQFWGGLQVFGRLRRPFERCNRVSDEPPENAEKHVFSKSADRRIKCVDPKCVVEKEYFRGALTCFGRGITGRRRCKSNISNKKKGENQKKVKIWGKIPQPAKIASVKKIDK